MPRKRSIAALAALLASLAAAPAVAQPGARYEIYPEPSVRRGGNHWVSSAYVLDKTGNRFFVCTAGYQSETGETNNGHCTILPAENGRPSLNARYQTQAVVGASSLQGPYYPVFWFVEPEKGDVQFCAPRHAGVCIRFKLPD
jgi:hypothetical protein